MATTNLQNNFVSGPTYPAIQKDIASYTLFNSVMAAIPTVESAVATIESALRKIHSDLIKEFRAVRLDPKAQADRYIASAEEYAKYRKKKDEGAGAGAQGNFTLMGVVTVAEDNEKFVKAIAAIEKCAI